MKNIFNNGENKNDGHEIIEIAKHCEVTKEWLFKQKQVNIASLRFSKFVFFIF